jgi:DNA-binding NarL/FixJ family response regulator
MPERKRILIVEDETLTAMALASYVEEKGFLVVGFSATGEDAVGKARAERPDLIFMDIRLAGAMDGVEAARLICADRRTPIVIITGYTDEFVSLRAWSHEPAAFLSKPIDFDDIDAILAAIC